MAGVLAYKRGGVLRRNQSHGNFFPLIKIIFSMNGVDLDIWNIDSSGDRVGEDRRRVQKIFCSQTPRAGGDHWLLIIIINYDVDDWWWWWIFCIRWTWSVKLSVKNNGAMGKEELRWDLSLLCVLSFLKTNGQYFLKYCWSQKIRGLDKFWQLF